MRNIFTVLTYRCNAKCSFCLFHKDPIQDCSVDRFLESTEMALKMNDQPVKIKITGGEPFIRLQLLEGVIDLANKYKDHVQMIGIGTNGFRPLPSILNRAKHKTLVYVSRHQPGNLSAKEFGFQSIPDPSSLLGAIESDNVELRLSCTITRSNMRTPSDLGTYIEWAYQQGIKHLCLRELNHLSLDESPTNYDMYIQDYLDFYDSNLVTLREITGWLEQLSYVSPTTGHKSSRDYIINQYYKYKDSLTIQLRCIDEVGLVKYNSTISKDEVDEYTVHPDGRLTGCWDRNLKIIRE